MTVGVLAIVLINLVLWGFWKSTQEAASPPPADNSPVAGQPGAPTSPVAAVAAVAVAPAPEVTQAAPPPPPGPVGAPARGEMPRVAGPSPPEPPPAREPELVLAPGRILTEVDQYHAALQELRYRGVDVQPVLEADNQAGAANQAGDHETELSIGTRRSRRPRNCW